jgi:hypothetical protein
MATHTIGTGGDFSSWQAWMDSLPATLTETEIGQQLNETLTISSGIGLTINGHATSSSNKIVLTTAPGASFRDNASAATNPLRVNGLVGALLRATGGYQRLLDIFVSNVEIRNLQLSGDVQTPIVKEEGSVSNVIIDSCIIQSQHGGNSPIMILGAGNTLINCLIVLTSSGGSAINLSGSGSSVFNCTFARPANFTTAQSALIVTYGSVVVKGCAFFGFSIPIDLATGGSLGAGSDYNFTDAATIAGSGTHNLTSIIYANQFQNIGSTSGFLTTMDFRIKSGSSLINSAVNLSGSGVTTDILGVTRPQGSVADVGCYEFPQASGLAPGNVSISNITSTSATVNTTAASGGTSPYTYQFQVAPDVSNSPGSWSNIGSPGSSTSINLPGLTSNTKYWVRCVVTDSAGTPATVTSSSVSFTSSLDSSLSIGIVGLINKATVNLSVSSASGGIAPYLYQFQRAPDSSGSPGTWSNIGSNSSSLTYLDTNLNLSTLYWYRVIVTDSASSPNTITSSSSSITTAGNSGGGVGILLGGGLVL